MNGTEKQVERHAFAAHRAVVDSEVMLIEGGEVVRLFVANAKMQESLEGLVGIRGEFEVVGSQAADVRKKRAEKNHHGERCEVLVMSSCGIVQEDLRQIREAKLGMRDLRTL